MASVTTSKFLKSTTGVEAPPFSLIEHKGLVARLIEELSRATGDFASDPRGFILGLFTDENKDRKRRRLLYAGLGLGLVAHFAFIAIIFIADWVKPKAASSEGELIVESWVPPSNSGLKKPEEPESSMPKGNSGKGGGGGGQEAARPASGGVVPQMLPMPSIIKHNAPEKHNPALPVNVSIQGPQDTAPPPNSTIGVPTGDMDAPPSPGEGTGGGLGSGVGTGVGPGRGPGTGLGAGGNKGGDTFGSPNGTGNGMVAFSQIPKLPRESGFSQFRWIYRPTPIVTPEAQENRVAGTVLLRATFHADGRITDIEIVNPVPFMTDSAIDSLTKSRFKPATLNGQPITVTRVPVRIEVHYTGKD
jgi:TonB family protein